MAKICLITCIAVFSVTNLAMASAENPTLNTHSQSPVIGINYVLKTYNHVLTTVLK